MSFCILFDKNPIYFICSVIDISAFLFSKFVAYKSNYNYKIIFWRGKKMLSHSKYNH